MFKKIMLAIGLYSVASSLVMAEQTWQLKRDKQDIQVYTAKVEGSKIKAYKGTVVIQRSQQQVLATLQQVSEYANWMPDLAEVKLIERNEDSHLYYAKADLPWPTVDRGGIYRYAYQSLSNGSVRLDIEAQPDAIKPLKGVIRIPLATGYWLLEPVAEHQTRVTYQLHADPGGSMPTWLINSFLVDSPYKTLKNLAQLLD